MDEAGGRHILPSQAGQQVGKFFLRNDARSKSKSF
jgi:hypothetical protein